MARPLRRAIADGWYHVFGRGLERRDIFADEVDRRHWLELMEALHERYRVRVHAYALMDNHHHAILQTPDANLSRGMQWLHGSYSAWFNARHQRVGPLFQGRYRALPVEDGAWAYALSVYVHLNPLRIASLGLDKRGRVMEAQGFQAPTRDQVRERLQRLRAYRWSSYRAYAGYEAAPAWLETETLLARAHRIEGRRRARFRADAQQRLAQGADAGEVERLRDAVAIGSAAFAAKLRNWAAGRDLRGIEDRRALRRRIGAAEVRAAVAQVKGERWEAFVDRQGDDGRDLYLWAARRHCGMTLGELGAPLGVNAAAVSVAIRRLQERAGRDPSHRERQGRVNQLLNVEP